MAATVVGDKRLASKFNRMVGKARKSDKLSALVGYGAKYALYVHENNINVKYNMKLKGKKRTGKRPDGTKRQGRYWDPQGRGQNQFLVAPFRQHRALWRKIIAKAYQKTGDLRTGLLLAAHSLQKKSQELVPVDSGNLKGSAYTKMERG